jgi:predicted  nucleic acid-binding Zn-ribbon protein
MTSRNPAQGRQRIGVTTLARLNIYTNLKQIIQDAIAPEIQSIKGDIKSLETQINSVQTQIKSLGTQIEAQGAALRAEIEGLRSELRSFEVRVDKRFEEQGRQWELAMEVRERPSNEK